MMSKRRPAGTLAAVLITAAATSALSTPAHSAPDTASKAPTRAPVTCFATTCHGLDPIATHCVDDAVTIADATLGGRIVRLRYSAECRAAWAQLWFGKPDDRAYVRTEDNGGHTIAIQSITVRPGNENSVYTPMVNDKDLKATACAEIPSLPPDSDTACTIFY
ncbi:YjfA family protein [Streptomyces sp. NBC_01077]|uniref:YjfA family protein n=1 Tax=Streptomyces sp. NBC_01077 TaxID=2903746 RepID=UPI00386C6C9E|nr:YjfA family protein [Streptomyces sp. NBC_01077]